MVHLSDINFLCSLFSFSLASLFFRLLSFAPMCLVCVVSVHFFVLFVCCSSFLFCAVGSFSVYFSL